MQVLHVPSYRRFLGALLFVLSAACAPTVIAAQNAEPVAWIAAWATAQQPVPADPATPAFNRPPDVRGRSVRQIVHLTVSGRVWRLRLSNRYGRAPLTLTTVTLAPAGNGARLAAPAVELTFSGHREVTLAPGESKESDSVNLPLAGGDIAISMHVADDAVASTAWHKLASQVSYISTIGDHSREVDGRSFTTPFTSWLFIDALFVEAPPGARTVVAIGDSISDGMRSTLNTNRRWPDVLSRRLSDTHPAVPITVVNQGISGNRLLNDSPCYGERLVGRYDHDALAVPGVTSIVVLIGINDIMFPAMPARRGLDCDLPHTYVSAADLIGGYQKLIAAAHRQGKRIYGGTLTPATLPPQRETLRQAVNKWIRESGQFDGVVDFDALLRDPANPDILRKAYDSGDHVHPNDQGYRVMGDALPLAWFQR